MMKTAANNLFSVASQRAGMQSTLAMLAATFVSAVFSKIEVSMAVRIFLKATLALSKSDKNLKTRYGKKPPPA
ncbi:hypothetical protein [uncultured Croceicoccus sp.]|uniref:hypothetical protein n=1 Tax=uncultured Croceicoccus sp. TaxID=1295329 RepID=UPI002633A050|nr:hypothetical protein [uncultured Croceicoccus sp.]